MNLSLVFEGIGALGAVLTLLWWVFQVQQTAKDAKKGVDRIDLERKEDKVTWGKRLEEAESSAEATRNLGNTIQTSLEHLTERFAAEIKHLSDHSREQTQLMRGELKEVSLDVKDLMAGRIQPARRRGSAD